MREDYFSAYAKAELNTPERVAYWQSLFEKQFKHPKHEKKHYVKWQCYIAAQWLRKLKTQQ